MWNLLELGIVLFVLLHASAGFRGGLDRYLGATLDFTPGRLMKYGLFALAVLNLLVPLVLHRYFYPIDGAFFAWWIVGGLLGDCLSLHIIPFVLQKRPAPGNKTVPFYLALALLFTIMAYRVSVWGFLVGTALFALFWPALFALRALQRARERTTS